MARAFFSHEPLIS